MMKEEQESNTARHLPQHVATEQSGRDEDVVARFRLPT